MKNIDIDQWKRKSHFNFFSGMDFPHFNICFEVDVTDVRNYAETHGLKFFDLIVYLSTYAANQIPEMKTRIRDNQVVEHEIIHPAFTIMGDNNIFNFCDVKFGYDSLSFFKKIHKNKEKTKLMKHLMSGDPKRDDLIYITSIPWINFTSIEHPIHLNKNDSIPRLSWGKFVLKNDRWWMPYSFQVHHALADGFHAGLFYETFQEMLGNPESYITN